MTGPGRWQLAEAGLRFSGVDHTTDWYVCSLYARIPYAPYALLRSFFSSNTSSLFLWLHYLLIPSTPRANATTHPQSYSDPSSSTLSTVYIHQTLNEATAKAVFSLYGDDHNAGTRQKPKVSSAIAGIYHCRVLAEVPLAHDCRQIMVHAQGGGRVLL